MGLERVRPTLSACLPKDVSFSLFCPCKRLIFPTKFYKLAMNCKQVAIQQLINMYQIWLINDHIFTYVCCMLHMNTAAAAPAACAWMLFKLIKQTFGIVYFFSPLFFNYTIDTRTRPRVCIRPCNTNEFVFGFVIPWLVGTKFSCLLIVSVEYTMHIIHLHCKPQYIFTIYIHGAYNYWFIIFMYC